MDSASDTTLVIDQGGLSSRARVFSATGDVLAQAQCKVETHSPQSGWFEQDPDQIRHSIQNCLTDLFESLSENQRESVTRAALIGQRSSFVACQKGTLQPLTSVISWQDTRADHWLQQNPDITNNLPDTGLPLNAHYGASKIHWLLQHDSAVQAAQLDNNLLFYPLVGYLAHVLTGREASHSMIDAATASRTWLTALAEQQWHQQLLARFSIPSDTLPAITTSIDNFGHISFGDRDIKLELLGGDQSFLPFAYGSDVDATIFVNAGTGAFLQMPLIQTATTDTHVVRGMLCSLCACTDERTFLAAEGTVNAAASALEWLWQQCGQQLSGEEINRALQAHTELPIFFNRVTALGSPLWLPAGQPGFSFQASLEQQAAAVIESIVFLLTINIEALQQGNTDHSTKPEKIILSGGLANIDGFCQRLADNSTLEVWRCSDHEASARGAAFFLNPVNYYHGLKYADIFSPSPAMQLQPLQRRFDNFRQALNEW